MRSEEISEHARADDAHLGERPIREVDAIPRVRTHEGGCRCADAHEAERACREGGVEEGEVTEAEV